MDKPNEFESSDFLRVLLALKENVMRNLNVADVAIVNKIENDDYYCSLLNDLDTIIICKKDYNLSVNLKDVVLIVYANQNFSGNLSKIKNGQLPTKINEVDYHSKNYGIITNIIYREN